MALLSLEVSDFRCIERASLELDARCNVISGENASGKTSLLESIHVLSCGHSFRSSRLDLLIRSGSESFLVVGKTTQGQRDTTVGIQGFHDRTETHVGGRVSQGFATLASLLPVQVIDPEVHRLLEDGPRIRRRFLDWGVFHVEPRFVQTWREYQRALKQRNSALKEKHAPTAIRAWDAEISRAGALVSQFRDQYVEELQIHVNAISTELLDLPVAITHQRGWAQELSLDEALTAAWARDLRYGTTTVGPHRADLKISVGESPAKERISRGQQKLLAASLILAQLGHRVSMGSDPACLLLDDPAAELDVDNLRKLLDQMVKTPAQIIVTALDPKALDGYLNAKRFHVKQGYVSAVL
jgi:DNA replication and repair protein RecF